MTFMSHHSRQRKVGYTKIAFNRKKEILQRSKKLRGDTNAVMTETFQTCSRDNLETKAVTS